MNSRTVGRAALIGMILALAWALAPSPGRGEPAAGGDRVKQLEHEIDVLKLQVKQLNATLDQMGEMMAKMNAALGDPDIAKKLNEIRAARTPAAVGKARKLADLTEAEKNEVMALDGQIKISTNPIEDRGRLVNKLWDLCVIDSAATELDKLLKDEVKAPRGQGDRWRPELAGRLNRDFGRFEKPESAEALLKPLLDNPLMAKNEKGMNYMNGCAGACRQLYTADPNKYRPYLSKAITLYEKSLELNPAQKDVKESLKALHKAKDDAEKPS